jgi:hypothetical protein
MADHGHCPFLNRTDTRCGEHLTIDSLDHAFEYCFDVYAACPLYLELLIERRGKGEAEVPRMAMNRAVTERMKSNVSGIVQVQVRRAPARQDAAIAYPNA